MTASTERAGHCSKCGLVQNQFGGPLMVRQCRDCGRDFCVACRHDHTCAPQMRGSETLEARPMLKHNGRALSLLGASIVLTCISITLTVIVGVSLMVHTARTSHAGTDLRLQSMEREIDELRRREQELRQQLHAHERDDAVLREEIRAERERTSGGRR